VLTKNWNRCESSRIAATPTTRPPSCQARWKRWHGHGIARRLWQRTMEDASHRAGTRHFTLHSSAVAVPVYRHLGFVCSGQLEISENGLITQPMHLDRS
jgi:predicted GNAT family N-acyltransferase